MSTVTRTERHSCGDLTLYVVTFSAIALSDTYASGLGTNVVGYWTNDATGGLNIINVTDSSGTFTFATSTAATAAKLFILATT